MRAGSWSLRLAAAACLAAGLAACRGDRGESGAGGDEPRAGGTAVVGMRTDFGAFNPVVNTDIYTDEVIKYALFTPLVQYDDELNVIPYLAESWELLGDEGVIFRIREGVHWHDGQPVTAHDVKFTFDLAKDPVTASLLGSAYLAEVASAEVLDDRTIRFEFARPHAQALEDFWWAPLPRHLLQDVPPGELANAPYNRNPVGSGPYRFAEWRANDRLVLERNPDFPETMGGPPYLERVVFRVIPEPATVLTELITGGLAVDVPLAPDQTERVEQDESLELFAYPGRAFYYMAWNHTRPLFQDAAVRRALAMSIHRENIIQVLLRGYGELVPAPIPPWSPLYPEGVEPLPYSPDAARELLAEAGWTDTDGDGLLDKNGRPFRFTIMTSDDPRNRSIVEVVQANLREVGIATEIEILEFQTYLSQFKARDYDAVLANWSMDNFQVASTPTALLHSRFAQQEGSTNRTGFADPRIDALIERAAATTDADEAAAVWREFAQLFQELQPFTMMFWNHELAASNESLIGGVAMDPRGELVTLPDWWAR